MNPKNIKPPEWLTNITMKGIVSTTLSFIGRYLLALFTLVFLNPAAMLLWVWLLMQQKEIGLLNTFVWLCIGYYYYCAWWPQLKATSLKVMGVDSVGVVYEEINEGNKEGK